MDQRLIAWARAVKSRRRRDGIPVLWLFTDARRLADPAAAAGRLPAGLCGVVLRHDGAVDRAALGRRLAAVCRRRRLVLVVAGDARLAAALGAGVHLREGWWPGPVRSARLVTSSAHGVSGLRRARLAGAAAVFLSPAFETGSHPGAKGLGPLRWMALARRAGGPVLALGGVSGGNVRRLARCAGVGAIDALA